MTDEGGAWTKWSIMASGEGAGRVGSLYYTSMKNEAIGDRVLLMNSARADLIKVLDHIKEHVSITEEELNRIKMERAQIFGPFNNGCGNLWKLGEEAAREDFDTIRRKVELLGLSGGDVILYMNTFGGGTGSGSIPYLINEMKRGPMKSVSGHAHMALGIWPYDHEGGQRHFNAICGMVRLLKYNGEQNADLVMLVNNTKVLNDVGGEEGAEENYFKINRQIVKAINLMIAPGRKASTATVDVRDYIAWARQLGTYHFTPCLAMGNDIEIVELRTAFDIAVRNSFAPLDPKTATIAHVIVNIPKDYLGKEDFEQGRLEEVFNEWSKKNIIGEVKFSTLTYSGDLKDTYDVFMLLGGFSLEKLMSKSMEKYQKFKEVVKVGAQNGTVTLSDKDAGTTMTITVEDIERIEKDIKDYIKRTEEVINIFRGKGASGTPTIGGRKGPGDGGMGSFVKTK